MAQPFNYMLDLPDPTSNLVRAINIKGAVDQQRQQEAAAQQATQARQQLQADLASLGPNATPAALSQLMVKYPQMSEEFKRTYDILNTEQQKSRVDQASQIYAALNAGQPDIAQRLLGEQAAAYRNSGLEKEAKTLEDLSELVRVSPDTARTSTGLFLASAMGPEKFTSTFTGLERERAEKALDPSRLTEQQAKAQKAAVDARFAESEAVLDLEKKGWDITKIQEDIAVAKENARIAAIDKQLQREQNELKRQELQQKLVDAQSARDTKVREKAAEVESARFNIDNMLNTADRILQTPIGVVEDATGPISSRMVTLDQDTADFEQLVENFDAQAFLAQIPNIKGMGALSDAEGKKLAAALQSFSLRQSPARLMENVREAQRLLIKARENVAREHGVPDTIPDTPAVESSPEQVDSILKKYGVQ